MTEALSKSFDYQKIVAEAADRLEAIGDKIPGIIRSRREPPYVLTGVDIGGIAMARGDFVTDEGVIMSKGRGDSASEGGDPNGIVLLPRRSRLTPSITFRIKVGEVEIDATESILHDPAAVKILENGVGDVGEPTAAILMLEDPTRYRIGSAIRRTGKPINIPVGDAVIGRVLTPVGTPIDGRDVLKTNETRPIRFDAPPVMDRQPVDTPLITGLPIIDGFTPIGRGQRQLFIGDRDTGKTAAAIDAIISQKGEGVRCVYVAVGKHLSEVKRIVNLLERTGAMDYSTVIVAEAELAPLMYIAPEAGMAIGEHVRDHGGHALVIIDDLTRQAEAYRQISALLGRPQGREGYPGDIFYLHARLLERAARLRNELGGGSLTAIPIVETQADDISAYIPTDVISITDGQNFFRDRMGLRPLVDLANSVSRVGGAAQHRAMRMAIFGFKNILASARDLEKYALVGNLNPALRPTYDRGRRIREILRQMDKDPIPESRQVIMLYAAGRGYLDGIPVERIAAWKEKLRENFSSSFVHIARRIDETHDLDDQTQEMLRGVLEPFNDAFLNQS